jgi:pimeloyl-ACP methyl ester carboxylesterase
VGVPTLVMWCREDRLTPLDQGEALARALPSAQFVPLDHCGHLSNVERSAAFNRAVTEFRAKLK